MLITRPFRFFYIVYMYTTPLGLSIVGNQISIFQSFPFIALHDQFHLINGVSHTNALPQHEFIDV